LQSGLWIRCLSDLFRIRKNNKTNEMNQFDSRGRMRREQESGS